MKAQNKPSCRVTAHSGRRFCRAIVAALALCLLLGTSAMAHPHVYVTVHSILQFNPKGEIESIQHEWQFDEFYSAYAVEGLGQPNKPLTRQDLDALAKVNTESLAEFDYFTFAKMAGKPADFAAPKDYWLEYGQDKRLTLHFTLPLKEPASASRAFSFQVYDATYFVAFSFDDHDAVKLASAPANCTASINRPKALEMDESQKLSESFFSGLSPGSDFGIKLASRAIIACP